jgi:glyoxalase superfamily protein
VAQLDSIVIDCAQPAPLARFWVAALDGYALRPYDADEVERLSEAGMEELEPEGDSSLAIDHEEGGPSIWFQQVPEGKAAKNRVHLDISAEDRDEEVDRLVDLGAAVVRDYEDEDGESWTVLQDPEGNEFCVVEP